MADPSDGASIVSAVFYDDPSAALDWLEQAFGFERSMVITDGSGSIAHAEMRLGDGRIMIGPVWEGQVASPRSVGGRNTQSIHVHLPDDIDAHCARAREAGASIVRELADQFYGDRTYSAKDPEGHVWTFKQTTQQVSREEAEKATGLKIDGWN